MVDRLVDLRSVRRHNGALLKKPLLCLVLLLSALPLSAGFQIGSFYGAWNIDAYSNVREVANSGVCVSFVLGYSRYPAASIIDEPAMGYAGRLEYHRINPLRDSTGETIVAAGPSFLIPPYPGMTLELLISPAAANHMTGKIRVNGQEVTSISYAGGCVDATMHFLLMEGVALSAGASVYALVPLNISGNPKVSVTVKAGISFAAPYTPIAIYY